MLQGEPRPETVATNERAALSLGIVSLLAMAVLLSGTGRFEAVGPESQRSPTGPRMVETVERAEARVIAQKPAKVGPRGPVEARERYAAARMPAPVLGTVGGVCCFDLLALPPPVLG